MQTNNNGFNQIFVKLNQSNCRTCILHKIKFCNRIVFLQNYFCNVNVHLVWRSRAVISGLLTLW